jgi:hypothetical protein
VYFRPVGLPLAQRITGGVNPDLMAALLQGPGEPQQRYTHAAYHGPVDLREQGDPHEITLDPRCAGDKACHQILKYGC